MKKLFISLLICAAACHALLAQEAENPNSDNHTDSLANTSVQEVHVYNNVVSKTVNIGGNGSRKHSWKLNLTGLSTTSENGDEDVKLNKFGEPVSFRRHNLGWHHSTDVGFDVIYLGWTELSSSDFDLNAASSWEWGFSLFDFHAWNRRETFGVSSHLILSRSSYRLRGDDAFHLADDGDVIIDDVLKTRTDNPISYSKQRLIHWSWRVPVMLNFQTRHRWGQSPFRVSTGAEFELRHHIRSRAKVGSDKKYYLCRRDMNINPIGCSALVSIGTDDFSIFGRYLLTDYFKSNTRNIQAEAFMVGINFFL